MYHPRRSTTPSFRHVPGQPGRRERAQSWGFLPLLVGTLLLSCAVRCPGATAADIFIRFKLAGAAADQFRVTAGGFRHADPWYFPELSAQVRGCAWSDWLDLSAWPWHGRLDREGGIAEWPSMKLAAARSDSGAPVKGCAFEVQLAERPDEKSVVIRFEEKSESSAIAFLVPNPLREHASEFETGSQMTARHLAWAREAVGGPPIALRKFTSITSIWGHYDPALARKAVETLGQLGFNVVSGVDNSIIRNAGMRTYGQEWLYNADPEETAKQWKATMDGRVKPARATEEGRWQYGAMSHWVISDEVGAVDFRHVDPARLNGWFREYLRSKKVMDQDLGKPVDEVVYPAEAMFGKTLSREASLPDRRLLYYAAKFGQWWSAKQLRYSTDLIKASLPGMKTETLPTDHGFLNAWGPPHMGMSYRLLDLFELGAQRSVDQLSAEDWLGLNHMYGPHYTWTGAQTFEYFNAIVRSAAQEPPTGDPAPASPTKSPAAEPIMLRSLMTPSDDRYLRLKAYSALGQGSKSFFFWTYGPTYIGTENYWSDLRSEYDGIAKVHRALSQAEEILYPASPVRDPVAILYSVSHDIWHPDNPAAFVEKRLLWHALRHLNVQPDFLREEDIESGRLNRRYRVLYVADWCVSRRASAAIDRWVRDGGVVYLSAGAATRDECYEPYVPPFASGVWPVDAAQQLKQEPHSYNERTDLPTIKPMARVRVHLPGRQFELPAIGCRLDLKPGARSFATFEDGSPAGVAAPYGRGQVIAFGFLPMLAYGQLAGFKPATLEEKWPAEPRELISLALTAARVTPAARASIPVVETSLLKGPKGSALVLANYTYEPISSLTVDLAGVGPVASALSTEGKPVRLEKTARGVRLQLPLEWTDIILLPNSKAK